MLFLAGLGFLVTLMVIFGGQIVHINDGKDKLALFSTKYNLLLTPNPSYSSAIDFFSLFLISLFIFNFHPRPHLPYIDPTSTLHGPHTDPTPTFFFPPLHFYCFPSSSSSFLLFSLLLLLLLIFCFPSTTTTTTNTNATKFLLVVVEGKQ